VYRIWLAVCCVACLILPATWHHCLRNTQQVLQTAFGWLRCAALRCTFAGKDYRDSVLKDARSSLIVFAGGDPDLRQAVTDGKVEQVRRTVGLGAFIQPCAAHDVRACVQLCQRMCGWC
jgi:hypothetical protein